MLTSSMIHGVLSYTLDKYYTWHTIASCCNYIIHLTSCIVCGVVGCTPSRTPTPKKRKKGTHSCFLKWFLTIKYKKYMNNENIEKKLDEILRLLQEKNSYPIYPVFPMPYPPQPVNHFITCLYCKCNYPANTFHSCNNVFC